jgi:glutathione synthase
MKRINKIVAIQGDAIRTINRKTDTTLLLALEAQKRRYKVYYYETKDLTFSNNIVKAQCLEIEFNEDKKKFYSVKGSKILNLSKSSFILMRQNPPFNMDYITATFLLEKVSKKTQVINNPFAVRNMPEKLYSIDFLKLMPPTIFTKNIDEIEKFQKKYKSIVIKPTHGYGGKNILFINKNFSKIKIINYIKKHNHIMVQKFLPQIKKGDKRVFIINGIIKGAIKRIPKKDSIVSNIAQGGKALATTLTKTEYIIAKKLL